MDLVPLKPLAPTVKDMRSALPLILLAATLAGCVSNPDKQLDIEKSLSVASVPRRADDIALALQTAKTDPARINALRKEISQLAAHDANASWRDWRKKAVAATELGDHTAATHAFAQALKSSQDVHIGFRRDLMREAALHAVQQGDFKLALELAEASVESQQNSVGSREVLARIRVEVGDIEIAQTVITEALRLAQRPTQSDPIQEFRVPTLNYLAKESRGEWQAAEADIRSSIDWYVASRRKEKIPFWVEQRQLHLARNLMAQQRFSEAEQILRETSLNLVSRAGKQHQVTLSAVLDLADFLISQRRGTEARLIVREVRSICDEMDLPADARIRLRATNIEARLALADDDIQRSVALFKTLNVQTAALQFLQRLYVSQSPDAVLAFALQTDHPEAETLARQFLAYRQQNFGENALQTREAKGILAVALQVRGQNARAQPLFTQAFASPDIQKLDAFRLRFIAEHYIANLHANYQQASNETERQQHALQALQVAELVKESRLIRAMHAAASRAATKDPESAKLVRSIQDLEQAIESLALHIARLSASNIGADGKRILANLTSGMEERQKSVEELRAQLNKRLGENTTLADATQVDVPAIQQRLGADEVAISSLIGREASFVWAIHPEHVHFSRGDLTRRDARRLTQRIRQTLDLNIASFDALPKFATAEAGEIFQRLLQPGFANWKSAKQLVFVSDPSLTSIPAGLLPVNASLQQDDPLRSSDWLGLQYAISTAPNLNALKSLRNLPKGDDTRAPFIGFGDPIFNPANAQSVATRSTSRFRNARALQNVGGLGTTAESVQSAALAQLAPLPETADEVMTIARLLKAQESSSVFLRERASEPIVKTTPLNRTKVLMFATHGLLAGDLDGLHQPALALTPPLKSGTVGDDGLLTLEEILTLKLDSDWVVLSACNTAGSDGQSGEALSGLGRAFFFAGTRALLATHWSVESESAQWLTQGLFKELSENPKLPKSEALRRAMLKVANTPHGSGRPIYAHPVFWAPFELAGDGR